MSESSLSTWSQVLLDPNKFFGLVTASSYPILAFFYVYYIKQTSVHFAFLVLAVLFFTFNFSYSQIEATKISTEFKSRMRVDMRLISQRMTGFNTNRWNAVRLAIQGSSGLYFIFTVVYVGLYHTSTLIGGLVFLVGITVLSYVAFALMFGLGAEGLKEIYINIENWIHDIPKWFKKKSSKENNGK